MKPGIIALASLLLVLVLGAGCKSASGETAPATQLATVQRGNLVLDITAAGNLALSRTVDVAFEMAGTVEEMLVDEGEAVTEGQVLARLDTAEWEKQIKALEKSLVTVQRSLATKESAVTKAERQMASLERDVAAKERAVDKTERQVTAKELALRQAELDLQTSENNVKQVADVKKAQDAVDNAEYALKFAKSMLAGEMGGGVQLVDYTYWSTLAANANEELVLAKKELQDILNGSSVKVTGEVALAVAKVQLQVEQSRRQLEEARLAVDDAGQSVKDALFAIDDAGFALDNARITVADARIAVEDSRQDVADAQKALDEARSISPEIKAPFTGFIARINVKGGDEVKKGTVAMQVADPGKFEADIVVSEMDIRQVKVGGQARVQVTAMPGMTLPATVTRISPTASIQSGVVNYKVKVEVQPLPAMAQRQSGQQGGATGETQGAQGGELPERIQQAIAEGRMTREQAEGMMRQGAQGFQGRTGQAQTGTVATTDFQLREGLTASVSIIVEQKNNVLLVPNGAITRQGTKNLVKVSQGGVIEEREVTTGVSNWQYSEVIEGLNEGEKVIVPQGTRTSTTRAPGMGMPGVGGPVIIGGPQR